MIRTEGRHWAGVNYLDEHASREARRLGELLPHVLARYGSQAEAELPPVLSGADCSNQASSYERGHGEVPCWS